jgi:hypothetical protein
MADSLVYLYVVGDAVLGENTPTGLTGLTGLTGDDGTPVRVIVDGQLGAVVSTVDPLHFSTETLQRCSGLRT